MSGSIPPHIKSISIPLIENETAEFGIAEEITDGIQKKFNDEGILKLIDKNADSILKGSIKKITDGPYTFNKQESVSEYRFKVDVYFEWYDNRNEKHYLKVISQAGELMDLVETLAMMGLIMMEMVKLTLMMMTNLGSRESTHQK